MTLPSVMLNFEKKRNATILKRAYSDLSNYVQMYALEKGCLSQLSECPERQNDFSKSFALYLMQKQKFVEMHPCTIAQNWLIRYFENSKGEWTTTPYYGCTKSPSTYATYYLKSPNGLYAYFLQLFPGDMFYSTKNRKDWFRLMVIIFTDQNKMGYITRWGTSSDGSTKKYPQEGRNMFTVFIMDSKRILPQGSDECNPSVYYCKQLTDSTCSYEIGNFTNCMMQVINDGWEIKYKY